ncbi:glycosyltransferase [Parenemella sanctibonifatiensis]|uniref:glycosyltransferase n=1 Tax=Parenemella sanctibonifatiensis TaxID=2016505 RepID=UPI001E52FD0F|nr:nucleotide disphospho-sugar-binding domain-containing protein [Parenemella sanctibonifatiensis]
MLFAPETFNLGETSRGIEVARQLRRWGHEVRFMGYSRRFVDHVREAGFPIDLLAPELTEEQADQLIAADQGRSLRHPFTTKMMRERVASELDLYRSWDPDCVVIGTTLSTFISTRAAGVPLIYVRPYAMSRSHLAVMDSFPVSQGETWLGGQVNKLAGRLVRAVLPTIRWKPASIVRAAAEHRVRLPSSTLEALDGDLNLIASLFAHLNQQETSASEIAVGPIYAQVGDDLPDEVAALAATGRPLVYVGLGSSGNRRLGLEILHQVAELDVEIVSTLGRFLRAGDREQLPTNVHVHDFLPAHKLAGLIAASVIHGGEGTVQTACASGAPFAGIGLQAEQRFNIDECVRHGNAARFTPGDIRRRRLPGIVTRLLADPSMRRSAVALQERARPVGAENAAREMVRYAVSRRS